ncbi:MAG: hypothetical protein KKF56_01785 [Nanoarchaeota archaeon]|nr:hypothetical protein [Nanoarchaeota archaeon]
MRKRKRNNSQKNQRKTWKRKTSRSERIGNTVRAVGTLGIAGTGAYAGKKIGDTVDEAYKLAQKHITIPVSRTGYKARVKIETAEQSIKNPAAREVTKHYVRPIKKAQDWRSKLYEGLFGRSEKKQDDYRTKKNIPTRKQEQKIIKEIKSGKRKTETKTGTPDNYGLGPTPEPIGSGAGDYGLVLGAAAGYLLGRSLFGKKRGNKNAEDRAYNQGRREERDELAGRLKEKRKGKHHDIEYHIAILTLGILGIILSIILSTLTITGQSIIQSYTNTSTNITNLSLFVISFILITIGIKRKT